MIAHATPFSLNSTALSFIPEPAVQPRTVTVHEDRVKADADWLAWDQVIDHVLIPWATNGVEIDDDLRPPSPVSQRTAATLVCQWRDLGWTPPTAVLPDGDGGILFELRSGRASVQFNVLHDGVVEVTNYDANGRLLDHVLIPAGRFA